MTSETTNATGHPVVLAIAGMRREVAGVRDVPAWSMTSADKAAALREIAFLRAEAAELELRVFHGADLDGLGTEVGAAHTASWWAQATRQTKRDTARRGKLANALDVHPITREAMALGHLAEDQATQIIWALTTLGTQESVPAETLELVEKELVRLAEHHDAGELHHLGKRILDVVAPELGEKQLRKALKREQDAAAQACRFMLSDDGNGKCYGRFIVPSAVGAMVRKAIMAIASPRHRASLGLQRLDLPGPQKLGQAFCEYVERYPIDHLPNAGGVNAGVVVTVTLETLLGSDEVATLDTGTLITAGEARRLACEAVIIPVVLDGTSQPLDVGRTRRFHTTAQRTAIGLRDRTCTEAGCDWPPAMCHVHHDEPWSQGGATNVEKGRLLCPRHHSYAHNPKYTMKAVNNGRVVFGRN
jgi:hypothetical protein